MNDISDIACCPNCRGDSPLKKVDDAYVCQSCDRVYAIQDGIPCLLPSEEASKGSIVGDIPLEQPQLSPDSASQPSILVIHGPNLNLLGRREPEIYGSTTLQDIDQMLSDEAMKLGCYLRTMQSNHEGDIINAIQQAMEGYSAIIINPGAYTHTSIAIRDALAAVGCFKVEVHLSNIHAREQFRHTSITAGAVNAVVAGFGSQSYVTALQAVCRMLGK